MAEEQVEMLLDVIEALIDQKIDPDCCAPRRYSELKQKFIDIFVFGDECE